MRTLAVALLALLPAQEKLDRARHPWLKWKEGSFATYTLAVDGAGIKQEGELTCTLSKVGEKGGAVRIAKRVGHNRDDGGDQPVDDAVKSGDGTVKVGEKEYACTAWKMKTRDLLDLPELELFFTEGVDAPIRVRGPKESRSGAVDLAAVSLKETVKVGEESLECVKLEGKAEAPKGTVKMVVWMTPKVPGGYARIEVEQAVGEVKVKLALSLAKYEAKK